MKLSAREYAICHAMLTNCNTNEQRHPAAGPGVAHGKPSDSGHLLKTRTGRPGGAAPVAVCARGCGEGKGESLRTQILSYGGGLQTVALVVLALAGRIEMPDIFIMADTGREKRGTFDYMDEIVSPALSRVGRKAEIASHDLATVDLYSGNGDLLIPVYTETGKLPTFCSTEWKERVVKRWLKANGYDNVDCWIGYSADEMDRADRKDDLQWYKRRYPLIEKGLTRADCRLIIEEYGWPLPHKSACWMCPNQDDDGWIETRRDPADWQKAIDLDREIRETDNVYLHESRQPIELVEFQPGKRRAKAGAYQCSFGCFL